MDIENDILKLLKGLSKESVDKFYYSGSELTSDELANFCFNSVLCIVSQYTDYLKLGDLGYEFQLSNDIRPSISPFPLIASKVNDSTMMFCMVAPVVVEVFDTHLSKYHLHIEQFFEQAAQTIEKSFSLAKNTNFKLVNPSHHINTVSSKLTMNTGNEVL